MEKTGVVIGRDSWLLRDEPLYSARFIDRDGTDELALVVRVEELDRENSSLRGTPEFRLSLLRMSDLDWICR